MILWDFMRGLEGFSLSGGVPTKDGQVIGHSGCTVATGCDIGQMTSPDLYGLRINLDLKARLKPYVGLKGVAAVEALADQPLTLTQDEARQLDEAMAAPTLERLRTWFPGFDALPDETQTVLFSVAWQYGDLPGRCPHFYALAQSENWSACVVELRAFGDCFPTRRRKEAALLESVLTKETSNV